jgi:hypothetical protein
MSNGEAQGWNPDYQRRDWEIVDYEEYRLQGISQSLRGPAVDASAGPYFSCLGAAQTYGVFVPRPYPALLAADLGIAALNLALPAAGPGFYAATDAMLGLVNRGKFVILQVMAARAEANSRYAAAGYCETVRDRATGEVVSSFTAWSRLMSERRAEVPALIEETRCNWIESYRALTSQIEVPILLMWISHDRRASDILNLQTLDLETLYFKFPQLVDATCLEPVKAMADAFVACESRRNSGHPLVSRFTGAPAMADNAFIHPSGKDQPKLTHNDYYPSPEMHEDFAADALAALRATGIVD